MMKQKKRKWSYMRALSIYLVFFMTVVASAVFLVQHLIERNNKEQMAVTVGLVADKMNYSIESMAGYAKELGAVLSTEDMAHLEERYHQLKTVPGQVRYISLGLVDRGNRIYADAGEIYDIEKYGFLEQLSHTDGVHITEPYFSSTEGIYVITFFSPFYQKNAYAGSVFITYPLEEIQSLAEIDRIHTAAETRLFNAYSGNIVHCSTTDRVPAGSWDNIRLHMKEIIVDEGYNLDEWLGAMRRGEDTGLISYRENGVRYMHMFQNLKSMDEWYITVRISDTYLSGMMQTYMIGTAAVIALLLAATLVLAGTFLHQERLQKRKLSELSAVDPLTNTMNRRAFQARVEQYFEAYRGECYAVLIFLDLDDFKGVNDTLGHAAGDEVLRQFAVSLQKVFGAGEVVARVGGDEFIVFLKNASSRQQVDERMAELKKMLCGVTLEESQTVIDIRFSAGLSEYPADAEDLEHLKKHADDALYYIKSTGKCSHCWFTDIPGDPSSEPGRGKA